VISTRYTSLVNIPKSSFQLATMT